MEIYSSPDYYPEASTSVILYKDTATTASRRHVLQSDIYALIVYLSSPLDSVSYSTFSDFFLIYRNFIEPVELYKLLILRFNWCIDEIGMEKDAMRVRLGQVALVRTFVLLRHGILNHFIDDFINNVQLRIIFVNFLNRDYTNLCKMIQDCIITLKKLWVICVKDTWENLNLFEPKVSTINPDIKKAWLYYRLKDITQLNRESTRESRLSFTAQQRLSNPDVRNQSVLSLFKDDMTYKLDVKQKNHNNNNNNNQRKKTHSMLLFPNNNSNILTNASTLSKRTHSRHNKKNKDIKNKNVTNIATSISKNQQNVPSAITDLDFPKNSQVDKILPATPAKNVELVLDSSYFDHEDHLVEEIEETASLESPTINTNDIAKRTKNPRRKLSLNETIGSKKTLKRSSSLSSTLSIGPKNLLAKWKTNHAKYKNQNDRIAETSSSSLLSAQKFTKPEMDKFVKYVISISSLNNNKNDQNGIDISDSSKFDILSARTIDEVEHLLLIQNQLLEKMNKMNNVSKLLTPENDDDDDPLDNMSNDSIHTELPKPSNTFSAMDNLDLYQTVNSIAQSVISLTNTLNTSNNQFHESSTPILGRRQVKSSIINFFGQTNNATNLLSEDPILENVSPTYNDGPQRLIFHTSSNESNSRPDSLSGNIIHSSPVKLNFSPKKQRSYSPLKKTLDDVQEVNAEDENSKSFVIEEVEGKVMGSIASSGSNTSSYRRETVIIDNEISTKLNFNGSNQMELRNGTRTSKTLTIIENRSPLMDSVEHFSFENPKSYGADVTPSLDKSLNSDTVEDDPIDSITDIYSHLNESQIDSDKDNQDQGPDNIEHILENSNDVHNTEPSSPGNDSESIYEDTCEDFPLSDSPKRINSSSNGSVMTTSIVRPTTANTDVHHNSDTFSAGTHGKDSYSFNDISTNDNLVTITAIRPASGRISIGRRSGYITKNIRSIQPISPLLIENKNENKLIGPETNIEKTNLPSSTLPDASDSPVEKPKDETQSENERIRLSIQPSIQSIVSDGTFSSFSTFETSRNERVSLRTKFQKDFASHDSAFESNVSHPKYFFEPDAATVDDVSPLRDMEELKNKVLNLDDSTPLKNEEKCNNNGTDNDKDNAELCDGPKDAKGQINENILKNIADITDESIHVDPLKLAMMKLEGTYQKRNSNLNTVDKFGFVSVPEVNKLTKEIDNLDISNIVSIPNTPMEKRRSLLIERRRRTIMEIPYVKKGLEETRSSKVQSEKPIVDDSNGVTEQITNIQTLLQDYKIEDPNLAMDNNKNHIPFILSYDSISIAEQLTLIEKELMCEIDWKDMLELKITYRGPEVTSWLQLLVQNETLSGIDLAVARFNLTVDWIISEIVLTTDVKLRRSTIQRYIHIAEHCRKFQNYNTLMQIVLALSSTVVQKYIDAWRLIEPGDMVTWEELRNLPSLNNNYQRVRGLLNDIKPLVGCIPFLVVYLSDLSLNSEKRSWIEEGKIINYNKFDTNVQIVKHFIQRVQWAKNYEIQADHELLSKCVYLTTLAPQEIDSLVYGTPVEC